MKIEIIGMIAGSLSCLLLLSMAIKKWMLKSADDVSRTMFDIATINTDLWLVYGILINSISQIFTKIVALILGIAMLWNQPINLFKANLFKAFELCQGLAVSSFLLVK